MIHNDYGLQLIEREIQQKFEDCVYEDYRQSICLLELRKKILNRQALANQKKLLPDIIAFNDALRQALLHMYDKAQKLYDQMSAIQPGIELEAKCFLSYEYPKQHPIQECNRQDLWNALCDSGWNPLYECGVTFSTLCLPRDLNDSFDSLIGMDCPPPNWNEGLDEELTKDLHLINAFHHLFEHTNFALTDLIYVREFNIEININIEEKVN